MRSGAAATTARLRRPVLRSGTARSSTSRFLHRQRTRRAANDLRYFPKVEDLLRALSDEIIHEIYDNLPDLQQIPFLDDHVSLSIDVFLKDRA